MLGIFNHSSMVSIPPSKKGSRTPDLLKAQYKKLLYRHHHHHPLNVFNLTQCAVNDIKQTSFMILKRN